MNTKPYRVYLDEMEIPVTPSRIRNKRSGRNEFYHLINGETFTVLRTSKLEEFSFSFYALSKNQEGVDFFLSQQEIISKLEELKKEKKAFEFVILRIASDQHLRNSLCKYMTLEDYAIEEDAKYGTNLLITVELKEYQPLKTITLQDATKNREKRQVYEKRSIEETKSKNTISIKAKTTR